MARLIDSFTNILAHAYLLLCRELLRRADMCCNLLHHADD